MPYVLSFDTGWVGRHSHGKGIMNEPPSANVCYRAANLPGIEENCVGAAADALSKYIC
jgi:hypothetical protein